VFKKRLSAVDNAFVNFKTGGVVKTTAAEGIVKNDINGHLKGAHSRKAGEYGILPPASRTRQALTGGWARFTRSGCSSGRRRGCHTIDKAPVGSPVYK